MEWRIKPIRANALSEIQTDYWMLYRDGNFAQPVAVITEHDMKCIVAEYMTYQQLKPVLRK